MTHIDFVIGFVLMITAIFLIFHFISNSISNELNTFVSHELGESSSSLKIQLFDMKDDKSLITDFKELKGSLTEFNGTDRYNEEIQISIQPQIEKAHVYDVFLNEITSTVSQTAGKTIISFWMNFEAYEEKRFKIIYFGGSVDDINHLSDWKNITLRMLSERNLSLVSQSKCSKLKTTSYDKTREILGFKDQFRLELDGCDYGPKPPLTTNIIMERIPVIYELSNGLLSFETAILEVW